MLRMAFYYNYCYLLLYYKLMRTVRGASTRPTAAKPVYACWVVIIIIIMAFDRCQFKTKRELCIKKYKKTVTKLILQIL